MRVELKQLQRRTGITFVYVTHDQAEALALSDQIAVIHGGRLQQYGTPHEVYAQAGQPHGRRLHGAGESRAGQGGRGRWQRHGRGRRRAQARGRRCPTASSAGDSVEVAIRPENIRLAAAGNGARAPRSASARSSAISASITPASTPVRRFGYRPIRRRSSRSATRSRSRSTPRNAVCFATTIDSASGVAAMNDASVDNIHIQGQEHWTKKGDVKLFLWEKRAPQNTQNAAPSCSCTARRWPRSRRSTCRCRAGRRRDGLFRRRRASTPGASTWRATAAPTRTAASTPTSPTAPTTCKAAHRLHLQDPQPTGPLLVYGISSGALRAALFAQRHPEPREAARARRLRLDRRRQPDAGRAHARSCRNSSRPSAGRSTARSCARSSSATIPAPPTTT